MTRALAHIFHHVTIILDPRMRELRIIIIIMILQRIVTFSARWRRVLLFAIFVVSSNLLASE